MHAVRWGSRAWRKNLDETVADPDHPQAFPARHPTDLMGRIRVRLCAEDGELVAYGFGGQRIALAASAVWDVVTVDAYRMGPVAHGKALLVLDEDNRILLRASGLWETYGEVSRVCHAAGVPAPSHVSYFPYGTGTRPRRRGRKQRPPLYRKAPGCRRLRTAPRGAVIRALALLALALAVIGLCAWAGVLPAVALPAWFGSVRVLIGIVGAVLGAAAGIWLCAAAAHAGIDGLRWAVASFDAGGPAPPGRFFRRRGTSGRWARFATVGLVLLVPALIGWGPGVAIASAAHGLSDSHLVAELRAQGVPTPGLLIDVPQESEDDNGNVTVTDVATLVYLAPGRAGFWQTTDPSIGGRTLPLDAADPVGTREFLTVVYLSGDPGVAAAQQQLTGSVWHGAPTANEITGIVFTLVLPPLIWFLILRIRRQRWQRDPGLRNLAVSTPA